MKGLKTAILIAFALLLLNACKDEGTEPVNKGPVIDSLGAAAYKISSKETIEMTAIVSDPEKDKITYKWTSPAGAFPMGNNTGSVDWVAPVERGNYTVSVTASDGSNSATESIQMQVMGMLYNNFDKDMKGWHVVNAESKLEKGYLYGKATEPLYMSFLFCELPRKVDAPFTAKLKFSIENEMAPQSDFGIWLFMAESEALNPSILYFPVTNGPDQQNWALMFGVSAEGSTKWYSMEDSSGLPSRGYHPEIHNSAGSAAEMSIDIAADKKISVYYNGNSVFTTEAIKYAADTYEVFPFCVEYMCLAFSNGQEVKLDEALLISDGRYFKASPEKDGEYYKNKILKNYGKIKDAQPFQKELLLK